ncbi:hypothetical protein [Phycicoccus sonneratiae]|uniref:Uncharacterized protein n=1 Tax=Phycicoccus sonneratiae TaxID=2807628 RepID=A0ABS2CN07_9MICO|nr:hypothetical protein [Phycicoccus sonneraticus]MBM6401269.1 hypothetical protein [Phycicoccus sonneraticus]
MAGHDPRAASDGEPEQPLLPSYRSRPDLDRALRANLRTLRDRCPDADLRERLDAVVAGRASLRELARSPEYQAFLGPLVLEGARRWEEAGRPDDGMPADVDAVPEQRREGRGPAAPPQQGGTW